MGKSSEFILFYIDKKRYAVPIQNIERVIRAVAITPIPESSENVLGVFILHGITVPVYDIRQRLGHPSKELVATDYFMVLKHQGQLLAIPVNQVDGIQNAEVQDEVENSISANTTLVKRVIKIGGNVILIINPVTMFEQIAVHFNS
jgi:purine-binding chemotaxis protein CheW